MNSLNILVANSKGGCGKTTVATNLAAAYANQNKQVALFDCDGQASSRQWAQNRQADLPTINLHHFPEPKEIGDRITEPYDVCVFDSAPGIGARASQRADFEALLKHCNLIVIPMLSSAWDVYSGEHFITQLLTQRVWRAHPKPIAVISNRVNGNLTNQQKLEHFLSCLEIPSIAEFRESPVYALAADSGVGVVEMTSNRAARKEFKAWQTLLHWVDENALRSTQKRLPAQPLAAPRSSSFERRGSSQDQA